MAANDTKTLHNKTEPRMKGLMSLMDIMGGEIVCDNCERWQRTGALTANESYEHAKTHGWTRRGEKDFCPICSSIVAVPHS